MSQNTSSAVMAQRSEPPDSLDYFPTPPWATRALCEYLQDEARVARPSQRCWEPACGEGHMVRPLKEYFWAVDASDVHDYGAAHQDRVVDFLWPTAMAPHQVKHGVDWTVTNPAFRLGVQFALTAIERSRCGVALLVRTAFLEGVDRHRTLFEPYPPALILQFTERVIMHKGVLRDPAKKYWDEATQSWKTPSSATSYCWIVWLRPPVPQRSWRGTRFDWLAPCRKRLERPGDYDNGGAA